MPIFRVAGKRSLPESLEGSDDDGVYSIVPLSADYSQLNFPEDRKVSCNEKWSSEGEIPTGVVGGSLNNTANTELADRRSMAIERKRIVCMRLGIGLSYLRLQNRTSLWIRDCCKATGAFINISRWRRQFSATLIRTEKSFPV